MSRVNTLNGYLVESLKDTDLHRRLLKCLDSATKHFEYLIRQANSFAPELGFATKKYIRLHQVFCDYISDEFREGEMKMTRANGLNYLQYNFQSTNETEITLILRVRKTELDLKVTKGDSEQSSLFDEVLPVGIPNQLSLPLNIETWFATLAIVVDYRGFVEEFTIVINEEDDSRPVLKLGEPEKQNSKVGNEARRLEINETEYVSNIDKALILKNK